MSEEEIKKMFSRIELDKSSDSCGFEFADGYGCTFDNIATCYDDRLKLYDFVKQLQQENSKLKERIEKAIEYIKIQQIIFKDYDVVSENQLNNLLEILKGDKE